MNEVEFIQVFARLTPREHEVLLHVLSDQKDDEIANQLYIAKSTVRKHIKNICDTVLGKPNPEYPKGNRRPQLISQIAKYRPELFGRLLDRSSGAPNPTKVLLSYYRSTDSELDFILQLYMTLTESGCEVFQADTSLHMAENGLQQICAYFNQCDYLLLLLSQRSAVSEMITEEVEIAKQLQNSRDGSKPVIIPIGMDCPFNFLNPNLRGYLQGISYHEWRSPTDTGATLQIILELLSLNRGSKPIKLPINKPLSNPNAAIPKNLPQPAAEPELPTGQVELASEFYVARPGIDERCYKEILRPGSLIRIKAPRQMGKTSLMARILYYAAEEGYTTVPLNFQLADSKVFADLEQFLQWFCINIALQLKNQKIWQKLGLVVVHSTEVYMPLDINLSPFNVGLPVDLGEFQPPMVLDLAQRHGLAWGKTETEQLMAMVGGHPYLVRLALYAIARSEITLEELLETAPTDAGLFSDHLRRHLWNLQQYPELAAAVKQVVNTPDPVELKPMQGFKLHSMGLINLKGNAVRPRCNLYRQYFRVRL